MCNEILPPKALILDPQDLTALLKLLLNLTILSTEHSRESILASASLEQVRPLLDLSGPPVVAVPLLVETLRAYGRVTYDQHALGRFLSTMAIFAGMEEAEFLNHFNEKYGLMVPAIKSPTVANWKTTTTRQDLLEKIVGENALRPIAFLQKGLEASQAVAYIQVKSATGIWSGTGFLVSSKFLITNHHVLPSPDLIQGATFRFNYQLDVNSNPALFADYRAAQNANYKANQDLDYAIIELEGDPGGKWGYLEICSRSPAIDSRVNIIQHPGGMPKQIAIQNNFVKYVDSKRIQYVTSTLPGSSGAPVLNDEWQVVALHHAGGWLKEGEEGPTYFRNEGIAMSVIARDLPEPIRSQLTIR